jgi:hypothetical protein
MHRDPNELLCPACGSYAHPFLEACPVCGGERASCYEAATAAPDQGLCALVSDSRVLRDVEQVVLRYTLGRGGATVTTDLHVGLTAVAGSVDYRVRVGGAPGAETERGYVEITESDLIVRDRTVSRERVRVPLEAILAVSPAVRNLRADAWASLAFDGRREPSSLPPLDGDLVVAHATPTGFARFSLANRRGLLSPRARPDHYTILARWIAIAAAAAAERRWTAVGPRRHAEELGMATAPPGGWPATAAEVPAAGPGAVTGPAAGPASVADALRLLDELRAARLVSDEEYAAKRREVLDRI